MKMKKKKFRIGELADKLGIERFVIRFWEKEFNLASPRSSGGQRFYDTDDLTLFAHIKRLLYDQGFTISGAKKQLAHALKKDTITKTDSLEHPQFARKTQWNDEITSQIGILKERLNKLRQLL